MSISFYLTPWRLVTLYLGTALLCIGADIFRMPDWDAGVSFLMAVLCYLSAPWLIHVLVKRQWKAIPLALAATWLTVDGSYVAYNEVLAHEYFREENFFASLPLFLMTGLFWYFGEPLWRRLVLRRTD